MDPPETQLLGFEVKKKKKNRGSDDGAKDSPESKEEEATASTWGRPEGSARGEGTPREGGGDAGGEGEGEERRGPGNAGGRAGGRSGASPGILETHEGKGHQAVPVLELDLADAAVLVE